MTTRLRRPLTALGALAGSIAALAASATPVSAHTGHPTGGLAEGLWHPLLGPDHLVAMLAVGVVAALVADRRRAVILAGGFVAGMVLGGAAGIAGATVPGVEVMVAASLVVLGALVVLVPRVRFEWLPLVALVAGAAHGLAHGAELPVDARPLLYVAGFVVATIALHATGALAGGWLRARPGVRAAAGAAVAAAGLGLVAFA